MKQFISRKLTRHDAFVQNIVNIYETERQIESGLGIINNVVTNEEGLGSAKIVLV